MDKPAQIYVGTAGWSYKDWEGVVYPAQIKKSLIRWNTWRVTLT